METKVPLENMEKGSIYYSDKSGNLYIKIKASDPAAFTEEEEQKNWKLILTSENPHQFNYDRVCALANDLAHIVDKQREEIVKTRSQMHEIHARNHDLTKDLDVLKAEFAEFKRSVCHTTTTINLAQGRRVDY